MDPDANLAELRRIIARARERADSVGYDAVNDAIDLDRLADLAEALDEWLSRGGFLPEAWSKHR
jgi:hypothetical protein